jgi:PEGA domain
MRSRVLVPVTLFLATLWSLNLLGQSSAPDHGTQDSAASTPAKAAPPTAQDSSKQNAESELPVEQRKVHFHLGTISVGAGYSHFSGSPYYYPYSYPFGPYGFYPGDWVGASLWYPVWGPYPYYGPGSFAYNNRRGEVRLTADPKLAEVYIDGGYAGTADKLKSLWLDPGAYDLTVSAAGREPFHQRLYVLSGKSLKVTAKLGVDAMKEKP